MTNGGLRRTGLLVLAALPFLMAAACLDLPWRADGGVADAGEGPGCTFPFAGDPALPPEVSWIVVNGDYEAVALFDGGTLPLMQPIQGGKVAFVGVEARNVDPCEVQLTAALRDLTTQQVRFDRRPVSLRQNDAGVAVSTVTVLDNFANVPLCPNQWASTNVYGHPFRLELAMVERDGRRQSTSMIVTPYCAEAMYFRDCNCACRPVEALGTPCDDGGFPDGGLAVDGG